MKNLLLLIFVSITINYVYSGDYATCKLIFKDSTVLNGIAKIPYMSDRKVKYQEKYYTSIKRFASDDVEELIFTIDTTTLRYRRILTYKNYGNKTINKSDSWLKVIKTGYLSLYYGYQPMSNAPAINMWYFKKENDTIAYYITGKYSGGLVFTVGTGHDFKQNASYYLSDNKELADKILSSEYKFDDIELIVDLYNDWYNNK